MTQATTTTASRLGPIGSLLAAIIIGSAPIVALIVANASVAQ